MDPVVSSIVAALAAGALAASKDVASKAVKDAYGGLKRLLTDGYEATFFPSLEKNPTSKAVEAVAAEELANSPALEDAEVATAVAEVIDAIEEDSAVQSALEEGGISITNLTAKKSVVLENLEARQGVKVDKVYAQEGDIRISGVKAGLKGN